MPFVYVLRCRDGSLYTGAAKDLDARLRRHAAGQASRYTRSRLPVRLVWSRRVRTWGAALVEEHRIKQLTRAQKDALVAGGHASRSSGGGAHSSSSHAAVEGCANPSRCACRR